jgi:hypothetical protein
LAANQIVGHVSKPVVIAAMFESNVLAHNVAGFLESLPECINHVQEALSASRPAGGRNMDHMHHFEVAQLERNERKYYDDFNIWCMWSKKPSALQVRRRRFSLIGIDSIIPPECLEA